MWSTTVPCYGCCTHSPLPQVLQYHPPHLPHLSIALYQHWQCLCLSCDPILLHIHHTAGSTVSYWQSNTNYIMPDPFLKSARCSWSEVVSFMHLKDSFQRSQKPITEPDLTLLQNALNLKNLKSQTWTETVILTAINEIWGWWPLVLPWRTYPSTLVQAYVHCAFELHVGWLRELESTKLGRQEVPINSVKVLKQVWIHWTPATMLHIFKRPAKVSLPRKQESNCQDIWHCTYINLCLLQYCSSARNLTEFSLHKFQPLQYVTSQLPCCSWPCIQWLRLTKP